jgi:hypothetical protein
LSCRQHSSQEAGVALAGEQFALPFRVRIGLLAHHLELGLELREEVLAMRALSSLLVRIVADDIALSSLPVASDDLLDAQITRHFLEPPRAVRARHA